MKVIKKYVGAGLFALLIVHVYTHLAFRHASNEKARVICAVWSK